MQQKYIKALADVLGIDLRDLQELTQEQQLQHLEMLQLQAVLSI